MVSIKTIYDWCILGCFTELNLIAFDTGSSTTKRSTVMTSRHPWESNVVDVCVRARDSGSAVHPRSRTPAANPLHVNGQFAKTRNTKIHLTTPSAQAALLFLYHSFNMQGFNMGRYYPPDASNPPAFNTTHPLGARASKISKGILTVRFELPFAVWCTHCKPEAIVGQGVRFNAAKKKVGNYYSTPVWSFRMKHSACGGEWEIRTDPAKSEYVVTEGCRRREYGTVEAGEGETKFLTQEEREKRREDAFAGLEGKMEQKGEDNRNKERVEALYEKSECWRDPYDVNAKMRQVLRAKRKIWKMEDKYKEGMQDKFSLGMDIADESESDRVRAKLVEFGAGDGENSGTWKPLFKIPPTETVAAMPKTKKTKSVLAAEKSRQSLQHTLVGNTRAAVDPFLVKDTSTSQKVNLGLLKRKRPTEAEKATATPGKPESSSPGPAQQKMPLKSALVDYDSD